MPQRQTEFLEMFLGQLWQHIKIDIVLDKHVRVFTQAKPVQPSSDLAHSALIPSI